MSIKRVIIKVTDTLLNLKSFCMLMNTTSITKDAFQSSKFMEIQMNWLLSLLSNK